MAIQDWLLWGSIVVVLIIAIVALAMSAQLYGFVDPMSKTIKGVNDLQFAHSGYGITSVDGELQIYGTTPEGVPRMVHTMFKSQPAPNWGNWNDWHLTLLFCLVRV